MERAPQTSTVRQAETEDVRLIVDLEEHWTAEDNTIGQIAASIEQVHSWLGPYCWVADHAGTIIGFVAASLHTSDGLAVIPAGELYLKLDELYVVPTHRDSGVGSQLVERVMAEAATHGVSRGRVYSSAKDWQRIVRFYQSHGFTMWYVEMYR